MLSKASLSAGLPNRLELSYKRVFSPLIDIFGTKASFPSNFLGIGFKVDQCHINLKQNKLSRTFG
jgi:hypothetical protein